MENTKIYYKANEDNTVGFYLEDHPDFIANPSEFTEISYEKWQELLNGQSEGNEIKILKTGEIGLYKKPNPDIEGVRLEFDYETETWSDVATPEEKVSYYENKLMTLADEKQKRNLVGLPLPINLEDEIEKYKQLYLKAVEESNK